MRILLIYKTCFVILFLSVIYFICAKPIEAATLTTTGVIFNADSSANSSRSRSTTIQVPENLINPVQGWIAGRIKMGFPSTTTLAPDPNIFDMSVSDAQSHFIYYDAGSDTFHFERTHTGGTVASPKQTFAIGDFKTVIVTWNATQIKISIDGGAFVTLSNANTISQAAFTIGSSSVQGAGRQPNSDYYWVAAGTGFLTDANAATIQSFGNTDKRRIDFPGSATFIWWANSNSYNDDGIAVTSTVTPKPTSTPTTAPTFTPTPKPTAPLTPTNSPTPTVVVILGDANGDGKVDGIDFVVWLSNYSKSVTAGPSQGDFNTDGKVDGIDYAIWLTHYRP